MAKFGSHAVSISMGGTNISVEVLDLPAVSIEALTEEGHGFGDDWVKAVATGLKQIPDITIKGFYDNTVATGTNALFNNVGGTSTLIILWDGTIGLSIPVLIKSYKPLMERGKLTKFEAVLACSGDPTAQP